MSFRKNLLLVTIPSFKLPPLQYSVTRNRFVLFTFSRAFMIQPYLCSSVGVFEFTSKSRVFLVWVWVNDASHILRTVVETWKCIYWESNILERNAPTLRTQLQDNPISLSNLVTDSKASNPNTHSMTWHLDMSPTVRMLSRKICFCCSCSCWGKDLSTVPLLKCHHLDFF